MDNALALIRAYLQLNGYFTITEYPVVRKIGEGMYRTLTDVDVAGFHFPYGEPDFAPDPALKVPKDRPDMIIGEVKEGLAVINENVNDHGGRAENPHSVRALPPRKRVPRRGSLLARGEVDARMGVRVRLVAFGSSKDPPGAYLKVLLSAVMPTSIATSRSFF